DAKVSAAVEEGRTSTVGTILLRRIDQVASMITPQGGGHTDSTGAVQVVFPAGAVSTNIDVTATVFPTAADFPVELPEGQVYLGGVQFTPEGLMFATPVTMRIKLPVGVDLPVGTGIPFAFANHSDQNADVVFFDPGMGRVVDIGGEKFIEAELSHFTCPVFALPTLPAAGTNLASAVSFLAQKCDSCFRASVEGGSRVGIQEGSLTLDVPLPSVRALGRSQGMTFVYTSATANPAPVIATATNLSAAPQTSGWRLRIEGTDVAATFQAGTGLQRQAFVWDATDGQGSPLPTGSYVARVDVTNNVTGTLATTDGFGGPPAQDLGIPAPSPAVLSMPSGGRVLIQNQRESPFGTGWGLQGLWRLDLQPDSGALLTEGTGTALHFAPMGEVDAPLPQTGAPTAQGLALDEQGDLYVAISGVVNGIVNRIDPATGNQTTIFSTPTNGGFPISLAASQGRLYVGIVGGSFAQDRVAILDLATGTVLSEQVITAGPSALAVDPGGRIYVHDGFSKVFRLLPDGTFT
ncbi:MAG: hypothetical protein ACE5G5_14575, partial [Candidatus Methylomirabilales bacterium]